MAQLLAKPEPDQEPRRVRPDVDAGADLGEPARLLVDLDVEAGLQQADRGGQPADAAADDRNGNVLRGSAWSTCLRHALAAHLVVAGDHAGAVGGRERRERRLDPRQRRIGVDVREQRLDAGDRAACRRTACGW